ncbi:MAG: ComEC/Rec2 family competence protein [Hyphomicrobiales bacterium]
MVSGAWDDDAAGSETGRLRAALKGARASQEGRSFLWAPIAVTFGIWAYFGLPAEPLWPALAAIVIAAALLLWLGRTRPYMIVLALLPCGFLLAKLKSEIVATPVLRATTGEVLVSGIVEEKIRSGTARNILILGLDAIEGVTAERLPRRLRLTALTRDGDPPLGARIAVKARLQPLPSPVIPGGFDYGRQLWFEGIGGTGLSTGPLDVLSDAVPPLLWLSASLLDLRQAIGGRLRNHLDGVIASFAEALITGERGAIPRDINRSLQVSGLAHILSISGLHMSMVAGGVFWFVRAMLAAVPALALRWPIKKWAAAAALVMGFLYMLLAGSGVATQRSYIMIAVVLFAVLVDRPAISVRNLALAALVILAIEPEAAISASFQMSFMAVMGLAAFYEFWTAHRRDEHRLEGRLAWTMRKLGGLLLASIVTTLIAGTLSSIPAAYHFGRLAPYGVVANGLALPVIGVIVMPMALAGVLLMPFGLEAWPLWLLGEGLELVMRISDWVADFPGAYLVIPQQSAFAAILSALGAALLCLLAGWVRLAGIGLIALAMLLGRVDRMPDILVESTAANAAFRNEAGELVFAAARRGSFAAGKWLQANGEEAKLKDAAARPGWTCEERRCTAKLKGKTVAYFREAEAAAPACDGIDILIADYPLRGACRSVAIRIDRFDVWRHGAHVLWIDNGEIAIATARGESGARPWVVVPEPRRKPAGS